jgi:hypothetical protein
VSRTGNDSLINETSESKLPLFIVKQNFIAVESDTPRIKKGTKKHTKTLNIVENERVNCKRY